MRILTKVLFTLRRIVLLNTTSNILGVPNI